VSTREKIILSKEEKSKLETISRSRAEAKSKIERATMLIAYFEDQIMSSIARKLHTNRPRAERCINEALNYGPLTALGDLPRKGEPSKITGKAKAWLIFLACLRPKDLGIYSEFWTTNKLAKYIRNNCEKAGHHSLKKFYKLAIKLAYRWINRRSQKKSYNWAQYSRYLKYNPLPKPKIYHLTYTLSS